MTAVAVFCIVSLLAASVAFPAFVRRRNAEGHRLRPSVFGDTWRLMLADRLNLLLMGGCGVVEISGTTAVVARPDRHLSLRFGDRTVTAELDFSYHGVRMKATVEEEPGRDGDLMAPEDVAERMACALRPGLSSHRESVDADEEKARLAAVRTADLHARRSLYSFLADMPPQCGMALADLARCVYEAVPDTGAGFLGGPVGDRILEELGVSRVAYERHISGRSAAICPDTAWLERIPPNICLQCVMPLVVMNPELYWERLAVVERYYPHPAMKHFPPSRVSIDEECSGGLLSPAG